MCVTFTRGLGPDEVLARYGADPERARPLDRDAASDLLPDDADRGPVSRTVAQPDARRGRDADG